VLQRSGGHNSVVADVDDDGDMDILNVNHGVYGAAHPIELFVNQMRSDFSEKRRSPVGVF